jgi:hypothetical protein
MRALLEAIHRIIVEATKLAQLSAWHARHDELVCRVPMLLEIVEQYHFVALVRYFMNLLLFLAALLSSVL